MMLKYAPMFLVPMTAFLACTQTLPDSSTAPSTQAAPLPTCQDLQHTLMTMECKEGQETCYVPHRSDFPQAVLTCGHGLLVYKQGLCRYFPDQATPELLAHVTCDYASVITSAATSAPAPDPHPNAPKINPMAEAHLRPLCESIQGRLQDAFCMVALTNVRLVVLHKEKIHSLGCGSAQPCLSPITSYVVVYEKATRQVAEIPNVQGRWVYDLFASTGARTPPLSLSKLLSEVPHKTITLTP